MRPSWFKPHVDKFNESKISNIVNREFNNQQAYHVVVSDLTYVKVGIGYSAGRNKDAALVVQAYSKVTVDLSDIKIFHTDRGNEFKNKVIDETLNTFNIERSLSMKGYLYDNAVAEATYI